MSEHRSTAPHTHEEHQVLRVRAPHQHNRVTFGELFFDLVFVFAVTQLSHTLMEHFTLVDAGKTLILLLAVWSVWIYTTWATNWLDPDNYQVRLLLFALMLAGLILAASIPTAFDGRGLAFAGAYAFMQVSRSIYVYWAFRDQPAHHLNFLRILIWIILAATLWLAGGFVHGVARIILWLGAVFMEYLSPSILFWTPFVGRSAITDWNVEGAHLAERCGLFIIIALGESILVTGSVFANMVWTATNVSIFIASFVGSLLLWWLYFDRTAEAASRIIAEARDPGRLARSTYTYCHLFVVGGIILLAVADEFILAHPTGHITMQTAVALLGGTAIYLVGNLLVKWTVWGRVRYSHVFGLMGLALLIPAVPVLSPALLVSTITVLLVALALWEIYYYGVAATLNSRSTAATPANIQPEQAQ